MFRSIGKPEKNQSLFCCSLSIVDKRGCCADEVDPSCWGANAEIKAWLASKHMTLDQLQAYFEHQVVGIARQEFGKEVRLHGLGTEQCGSSVGIGHCVVASRRLG